MAMDEEDLNYLLGQRGKYLLMLKNVSQDPNSCLSPSISDDSEYSDDESEPSKVLIKTEPDEHNSGVQQNVEEVQSVDSVDHTVNIKLEHLDDKMDCVSINDGDVEDESDRQVLNGEVNIDDTKKTAINDDEVEKTDENISDQDDQTGSKTSVKQGKTKEEENCNALKPAIRCRKKSKRDILENDHTSKIESRKSIKIKQEPFDDELDDEDMIDGVKRELRPRKLNDTQLYFEPYDGTSSSEESDFSDLLN